MVMGSRWPAMETIMVVGGRWPAANATMELMVAGREDSHGGGWSLAISGYSNGISCFWPAVTTSMVVGGYWPTIEPWCLAVPEQQWIQPWNYMVACQPCGQPW